MQGIVKVPWANVYRAATRSAEMVTQVVFATMVPVWEEAGDWLKIQIPIQQNYTGWVKKENVFCGEPLERCLKNIVVHKDFAALKDLPCREAKTLMKIPLNTRLQVIAEKENWFAVWIPGGGKAWINKEDQLTEKPADLKIQGTIEKILHLARTFVGVPYLWGGLTPAGFDCSGFVYTLFALHGYYLHRDADLQYKYDGLRIQLEDIYPGDLLFFHEGTAEIPTHVGIYEGEQKFINASSKRGVVSYSLEENDWRFKISGAKRVLMPATKKTL